MRLLVIFIFGTVFQAEKALAIAPKVKDGSSRSQTVSSDALKAGRKYLITSFPQLKQVAAWQHFAPAMLAMLHGFYLVQECFDHRIGDLFDMRKLANSQSKSPCCNFLLYGSFILISVDLNLEMFPYVSTCFNMFHWRPGLHHSS